MNVVFLDFDGVLNANGGAEPYPLPAPLPSDVEARDAGDIDPAKVAWLNELVVRANAKVVVSSTWRNRLSVAQLRALLAYRGFVGELIDGTPTLWRDADGRRLVRGDEIAQWLRAAPTVDRFVILDDDEDMGSFLPRLVRTDAERGLGEREIAQALALLAPAEGAAAVTDPRG